MPTQERIRRVEQVLALRQPDLRIVLEEIRNTHNASAVARTCDAVGVMDIDIIYFEDGIRFKELKAVFEIIFELYHNRGAHFRLEEYHFIGLNDARVVVEMIRADLQREKHDGYPETHFTNLSQARILMVFKDRGGGKDLTPTQSPGMAVPEWS